MAALRWSRRIGSGRGYLEWHAGVLQVSTNQISPAFLGSALPWQPLTSAPLSPCPCSKEATSGWETPWMRPGRARGLWLSTVQQQEHHRSEVKVRLHFGFICVKHLTVFHSFFLFLNFGRVLFPCCLLFSSGRWVVGF